MPSRPTRSSVAAPLAAARPILSRHLATVRLILFRPIAADRPSLSRPIAAARPIPARPVATARPFLSRHLTSARPILSRHIATARRFTAPALLAVGLAAASSAAAARPATDVGGPVAPGTTWTLAGSPYVTTGNVTVPAGVTLTIEPGVTVRLGAYHALQVSGALQAVGSPEAPVRFEPSGSEPWSGIQLAAGSGPSELGHVALTGGGAAQREMLGIATDAAVVHHMRMTSGKGLGIEIKGGASPTIRDSSLFQVTSGTANPPAALRILGPSQAVVTDNFFQSNVEAVVWDADASPTFLRNRFDRNGVNGVKVSGRITRPVAWSSLGPRAWAYHLYGSGLEIAAGGALDVGPGATLRFANGSSLKVRGTLAIRGTAGGKVLLSDDIPVNQPHKPGQWREVRFEPDCVDYDPATGLGSVIDHAIIEYGGSNQTGAVYIADSSPRLANTVVRESASRGIGVRGADARPQLVAVVAEDNVAPDIGIGLEVTNGAAPEVSFSAFRANYMGVKLAGGSQPRLSPHNRFAANQTYAAVNEDYETCVDATGNDWSGSDGPLDQSPEQDACGLGDHLGSGELVSDHIDYRQFEGRLAAPYIDRPRCGTTTSTTPEIGGLAPPGADGVVFYDNQTQIGRIPVTPAGDAPVPFSFTPPPLAPGSHVVQVQSVAGETLGSLSEPLDLMVDPSAVIDPSALTVSYDLDGGHFVQPYLGDDGCANLRDDNGWTVRPLVGPPITLAAAMRCPSGAAPAARVTYLGEDHPMTAAGDGRLAATFAQGAGGTFAVHVDCDGATSTLELGTINPSADGFVHHALDGVLARVVGAQVTLLVKAPGSDQFLPWNGADWYGQTNPQTTGWSGWYAFYPPPGTYRVQAGAEEYQPYLSAERTITTEPIMFPVPLMPIIVGRVFLPSLGRGPR